MSQELFFQELRIALHREGFTSQPEQGECLPVEWGGFPLCRITAGGGVRYRQEDVATSERERACEQVTDLACTVREYRGAPFFGRSPGTPLRSRRRWRRSPD